MPDYTELKQKHRKAWASGDYDQIARGIMAVADHVVRSARVRAGERVLDIACGTGNTALAARARGAEVTGLDLTPELLAVARQREAAEGLSGINWQEGTPRTCRSRMRHSTSWCRPADSCSRPTSSVWPTRSPA